MVVGEGCYLQEEDHPYQRVSLQAGVQELILEKAEGLAQRRPSTIDSFGFETSVTQQVKGEEVEVVWNIYCFYDRSDKLLLDLLLE